MSDSRRKRVVLILNRFDVDYINEALDMLANYRDIKRADDIGQRLVDGWNNAQPLSTAEQIIVEGQQRRKRKVK